MATQSETRVLTGKCTASFVHLLKPYSRNPDEKAKYSVTLLIPKSDKTTVAKLRKAAKAAMEAGIASNKLKPNAKLDTAWTTMKDGDEHEDLETYPEFAGHYIMTVSATNKPGVVDRDREDIEDPEAIYSGMKIRASLNAFAYSGQKRGVTFGLNNVQKLGDGPFLGGRSSAKDDFDEWDEEDDDDMLD